MTAIIAVVVMGGLVVVAGMMLVLATMPRPFKCNVCGREFWNQDEYIRHTPLKGAHQQQGADKA
jgi:hypothetical protein